MDSSNKQTALIAEVTVGTTPATPAFLLTRDIRVTGGTDRPNTRSPERRADRMAASMVQGLTSVGRTIETPYVRDAATDVLWTSLLCGAWSTNVLKAGSTQTTFSLEEKYEGGATDPYRRATGCQVNSLSLDFSNGNAGTMSWDIMALAETTATATIASATYTAPSPGYDPSTSVDIAVTTLFGLTTPKVTALQMTIANSLRRKYGFGSADAFGLGLGEFNVMGSVELYFAQLADYSTFVTKQTAQTFDITIGATTNYKDRIVLGNCDVWNPGISDPGQSDDHKVTLNFMAKYYASDTTAMKITRLVA